MNMKIPDALTIEESVALLINHPLLPEGCSLEEVLQAAARMVEDELEQSANDRRLKNRIKSLDLRIELARSLTEDLENELERIASGAESEIEISGEGVGRVRILTSSLLYWANEIMLIKIQPDNITSRDWLHSTGHLDALNAAIKRYYGSPESVAPKDIVVAGWIREHYPRVSEKAAQQMCRIMKKDKPSSNTQV